MVVPQSGIIERATRVCKFDAFSKHLFQANSDMMDDVLLAGSFLLQHVDDGPYLIPHLLGTHRRKNDTTPAGSYFKEKYGSKGDHCGDI